MIDVVLEEEITPAEHIEMKAVFLSDKATLIDLPEDLMDHDERPLVAACACNRDADPKNLILNCARVRSINGLGASMLVKLSAHASNKGQSLSAFGVGKDLREIFRVTELDQAIQIHASQTEALSAVGISRAHSPVHEEQQPCALMNLTSGPNLFLSCLCLKCRRSEKS